MYNKRQEAKREKVEEISIKEFYETIYLYYLNFNNWQEFRDSFELETNWKQFQCFYYSFKRHEVGTFIVQLGFGEQVRQARVRGFHDETDNYLEGTAKHEYGRLDVKVSNNKNYEITLIATTGTERLENLKYMHCAFLTVSSIGFPISHRGFLIKVDSDEIEENDLLKVKRYMMLKRKVLRVPSKVIFKLDDLQINGNNAVDEISHMIGTYRIWRYNEKGDIVQSKLTIKDDYTTTLYSSLYRGGLNTQTCVISISTQFNHELCLSAHPAGIGTQVISYAIIEIPYTDNYKFIHGVFCTVGVGQEKSIGRNMILYMDETNFEPKIINKDEIEDMIQEHADLHLLQSKLAAIEEKRFKQP